MPDIFIIGGPNGAGKTTASFIVLPELLHIMEFVNADEIARGLSPFNVEAAALEAGRIMLHRMEDFLRERKSFAFESTLASKGFAAYVKRAREAGFHINISYYWLKSPEQSAQRVARRVTEGGHNIPLEVIQRRYLRGLRNFLTLYSPLADSWSLFDNSGNAPVVVAEGNMEIVREIYQPQTWDYIHQQIQET